MERKNKIVLWAAALVLLLAIPIAWYYTSHRPQTGGDITDSTAPSMTTSTASGSRAADSGIGSSVGGSLPPYDHAINIYAKSRIQFDSDCRMLPEHPVFKNGITVMFDNRHRDARTFKLDGTRYSLPGYGYKLLKLTAQKLPHVVDVDCGTNQNTGKITLE